MIKIILIDNDERNYLTLKNIIGKLDFLYSKNLIIKWYTQYSEELGITINEQETKKIYFINNKYELNKNNSAFAVTPPVTALLGDRTIRKEIVAFPELGMEAFYKLEVQDFPMIIAAVNGKSIY